MQQGRSRETEKKFGRREEMPVVEKFDFCQTMRMAEKKFEMEKRKERELWAEIIMLTKSETDREKNSNYKKRLRQSEKE